MIKLNILPDQIKKDIKINLIYSAIKEQFMLLIFISAIVGIILLLSQLVLELGFVDSVNEDRVIFNLEQKHSQSVIREINSDLSMTNKIQLDFITWSSFLERLSKKIPTNISVSNLSIDKEAESLNIRGVAISRNDLLNLKNVLEEMEEIELIEIPLQNILQQSNIEFNISTKIDNYEG